VIKLDIHTIENRNIVVRIAHIHVTNEIHRNSIRGVDLPLWSKSIARAEKESDVLLVTAEGSVFCSGGNLSDHAAQGRANGLMVNLKIGKFLDRLSTLKIPTVALVGGDVYGGGLEFLSAFDHIVGLPHCLYGFWQRRMGLSFGWGGGRRLKRRLLPARLSALSLEARVVSAGEALRLGLIDETVPRHSAMAEALALALRVGSLPKRSVSAIKRATQVDSAAVEASEFKALWFQEAHREALTRFGV